MSRKSRMKKASMMALCAVLLVSCSEDRSDTEIVRPIISTVVENDGLFSGSGYPGVVHARVASEHGFRILGNVDARSVEVGDNVREGQVLSTLESSSQTLAVSAAEADVRNAQAKQFNAKTSRDRQQTLAEKGLGTTAALEQSDQALRTAEADVLRANAILGKAREQLGYTILRAQFDGIVIATAVEVGQTVDAGQHIVTVAGPQDREVVIDVNDVVYERLQIGTPFDLHLQLDEEVKAQGVVRELGPTADALTRTRRVRISLRLPPDAFRIGSVVTAFVSRATLEGVSIPRRAVSTKGEVHVWVVNDETGTVSRRVVEIDNRTLETEFVRVLKGLSAGERISLAGLNQLSEGRKVRTERGVNQ